MDVFLYRQRKSPHPPQEQRSKFVNEGAVVKIIIADDWRLRVLIANSWEERAAAEKRARERPGQVHLQSGEWRLQQQW